MVELPSIDDLKSRAKRQKTEIASLKAAFSTCSSLNVSEEKVCKLSQEEREIWLVAKFGLTQVNKLCRVMKSIPSTLTKKQKEDFAIWGRVPVSIGLHLRVLSILNSTARDCR